MALRGEIAIAMLLGKDEYCGDVVQRLAVIIEASQVSGKSRRKKLLGIGLGSLTRNGDFLRLGERRPPSTRL
jgi:hypothetical protein